MCGTFKPPYQNYGTAVTTACELVNEFNTALIGPGFQYKAPVAFFCEQLVAALIYSLHVQLC